MKKTVISENQRGFLFKNGRFVKFLEAGKYRVYGDREIETVPISEPVSSSKCSLDVLMECPEIKKSAAYTEVPDRKLAFLFINGKFSGSLRRG